MLLGLLLYMLGDLPLSSCCSPHPAPPPPCAFTPNSQHLLRKAVPRFLEPWLPVCTGNRKCLETCIQSGKTLGQWHEYRVKTLHTAPLPSFGKTSIAPEPLRMRKSYLPVLEISASIRASDQGSSYTPTCPCPCPTPARIQP